MIAVNAESTITVTNTLNCNPPPAMGTLKVVKSIANETGAPVVAMPTVFAMKVDCATSGPHLNISVPVGSTGTTIASTIAPSLCSLVRNTLTCK